MTLERLEQFTVVAKYLKFSTAAEHLFMHQTAVSKNIAKLEHEIGAELFVRKKHSLELTEVGHVLLREATELLERYELLNSRVHDIASGQTGKLRIMAPLNYMRPLSEIYNNFIRKNPSVEYTVTHMPFETDWKIMESVENGDVDLGMVFTKDLPGSDSDLDYEHLYYERFCVVAPPDHPLSLKDSINLRDLIGEKLLTYKCAPRNSFIELNDVLKARTGHTLEVIPPEQSPSTQEEVLMQIADGRAITVTATIFMLQSGWNYKKPIFNDFDFKFPVLMVWRKDNFNPALKLYLETLRKYKYTIEKQLQIIERGILTPEE